MWIDNETRDVVDEFWRLAGESEPFPRDLERPLALALPVALVKLPRLHLADIERWLRGRGARFRFGCRSRPVRGCLLAYGGNALIFLDGTDSPEDRRFTVAHETGHFLIDYWRPRHTALARLGRGIVEVLDGFRAPTLDERVHALLSWTRIGLYSQLMERNDLGDQGARAIWAIEDRADKVALSLLAPPEEVIPRLMCGAYEYAERRSAAVDVLTREFGLPHGAAAAYADSLLSSLGRGRSWVEGLG